jgi:hypothetical protein
MFREIQVFETRDGKRFDDDKKASEHVANACRELIDARLESLVKSGHFSKAETFRIVMALIPDADAARKLSCALAHWTDDF